MFPMVSLNTTFIVKHCNVSSTPHAGWYYVLCHDVMYFTSVNFPFQLLRQLLDQKMIYNLKKPFDRRYIEGLTVTAAMTTRDIVGKSNSQPLSDRLLVSSFLRYCFISFVDHFVLHL